MTTNTTAQNEGEATQVDFEALHLRPGAHVQIQHLTLTSQKFNLRFIGAIKGRSILTTLPFVDGQPLRMPKGQSYVVRGFDGRYAYAFTTHVLMARAHPFHYVHFAYPPSVEHKTVRRALRVNVNLPATVAGKEEDVAVTLLDLSAQGSMISSSRPIGEISDTITVRFDVTYEEGQASFSLPARIRNAQYSKDASNIHVGVEFEEVPQNEMLILSNFLLATSLCA